MSERGNESKVDDVDDDDCDSKRSNLGNNPQKSKLASKLNLTPN